MIKFKDITLKNISAFIEGNSKQLADKFNLLPKEKKEQVAYRYEICKDTCGKLGKCEVCGCKFPGKIYVNESCNKGEKFPDIMSAEEWEKYKKENNIKIEDK